MTLVAFQENTIDSIKHRALPAPIVRAMELSFNPLLCQDLKMNARRVLAGILSHIRYNDPKHHIYPSQETLMASAKVGSTPTLNRGLKELQDKNYLTREQVRQLGHRCPIHRGRFYFAHIWLTDKALEMVGLLKNSVVQYPEKKVIHIPRSTKMSNGIEENTPESKRTVLTENSEARSSEIDKSTHLPKPLLPLLELGLEKPQVCHLMKLCKDKPFRLQDVMKSCWQSVVAATSPVAYLTAMITKKVDYAYVAKSLVDDQTKKEDNKEDRMAQSAFVKRDGWMAVNEDGDWLGTIESPWHEGIAVDSVVATIRWAGSNGAEPINLSFLARVRDKLNAGELRFVPQ